MFHVMPKNTEVFKLNCYTCTSCVENKLMMGSAACGRAESQTNACSNIGVQLKTAPCQINLFCWNFFDCVVLH